MSFTRESLNVHLRTCLEQEFDRVPYMREFNAGAWFDRDYYERHLVETVLRIRLNNEVDSFALSRVGALDDELAATLAQYLAEEYGHEHMFARDLQGLGWDSDRLNVTRPMIATEYLMGYLYLSAVKEGPAATTIWNYFVEWYSDEYNQVITDRAKQELSDDALKGSQMHLDYDEEHDHDDLMWKVVDRAVSQWSTPESAFRYASNCVHLVGMYFQELAETTVGLQTRALTQA